jgi:glycosyltransferase involved in cell wall biosynthesis
MLDFVMVIPTLNEQKYVGEIVESADVLLASLFNNYRIVVVDDSSKDATTSIVKGLIKSHKSLRLIEGRSSRNRGLDVRYAMSKYESRLYFFTDADLKPSLLYIPKMIKAYKNGCDVVTGSRYADETLVSRPPLRKAVSKCYNFILNVLFDESIKDHQCGFKLFSRKAFKIINKKSVEKHWLWDVETLLIAYYNNMQICEVPIRMIERRSKRTPIKRLISDITIHGPGILRLFYRYRILKEYKVD